MSTTETEAPPETEAPDPPVEEPEVEENSLTPDVEVRAGKVISQKNLDQLQNLHDSLSTALDGLRDLMDVAKGGGPQESEIGPMREENSLSLLSAQIELRARVVAAEAA